MRRAYTLLVDNAGLECPARVSTRLLRAVDPHADVVVLAPPKLRLRVPEAIVRRVRHAAFKGTGGYRNTFMKFRAFELFEYDAVMMLDLDVVPWASPARLFEAVARAPAHVVAAPRAYWLRQPFLSSGGPVVFRPSAALLARARAALDGGRRRIYPSEMDWFNQEFRYDALYTTGFDSLLNGEFVPGDAVHGHWGRRMRTNASATLANATFVHCIAGWKPWVDHPPAVTAELRRVYATWDAAAQAVCPTRI